ncbi:MAG: molybdopterin-dependent oxidoreductase [Kiloniellaceae bacterium]
MTQIPFLYHSSHWGTFRARMVEGTLELQGFERDPAPSPLLQNIPAAIAHPVRLRQPLIRRGWLQDGPGPDPRRGTDDYVAVSWDRALDLVATELQRLGAGPSLPADLPGRHVFGGSYGWSSAGRFHHAQSQVHRFLNTVFGGYVRSADTYSSAAGAVILDLVWGDAKRMSRDQAFWDEIAEHSDLVLAFGGLPLRNLQVSPGGTSQHSAENQMQRAAGRGCCFVSISPVADDMPDLPGLMRLQPRPATDVALMLGMAHRLQETGRVDRDYLERYTTGYDHFERYLTGQSDGTPKTPEWAAGICGLSAETIRDLADRAAAGRTHVTVAYGLQRSRHGEQPVWMALTLAAMLGQWALPGGGFSYSLGSMGSTGKPPLAVPLPSLPQGRNGVKGFIPVARISELLLNPGKSFTYKGETHRYGDIRLVYWAGGNPFHHHQDLSRLAEAFTRPDTIIVHDSVGTATTRHADIVLPATITAEREDIGAAGNDPFLIPMQRLVDPPEGPRDDFDIFADLAARLGCKDAFTEGRSSREWLAHLYEPTRSALLEKGMQAPDFEAFMQGEVVELPVSEGPSCMQRYHADPVANALSTPSGKIEISSAVVERAGLPPHPAWVEPEEWLGAPQAAVNPFQLVANQPRGKLHSQLDFGATAMGLKRNGRERARMNPDDAARLGIAEGDVIRIYNDRGALLAAAEPAEGIASGVVQLSTGAWYAPLDLPGSGRTCVNGNPNAVTSDIGTSPLSQGCAGQLSLVSVERWSAAVPEAVAHEAILPRKSV